VRSARVGGALLALALTAGCTGAEVDPGSVGDPVSPTADETAPSDARDAPRPQLQGFYDQEVAWEACGGFECGRVEVPLDYADPEGDRITLALLRNEADDPGARIGSLVVNPGGPGAPGTSYAGEQARYSFGRPLLDRYDLIGVDPRGTGQSAVVDCLTDAQLDAHLARDPSPDDAAEQRAYMRLSRQMGRGCVERSGDLASHVSTHEAARDLDIVRAVLEEEQLTYFGASYGTQLGATYADLFPERSGRLVLDGGVDIALHPRLQSLQQARGFETALTAYVDDCVANPSGCYLGDDRASALGTIRGFLDRMDARPLSVGDRELTEGLAMLGVIVPLYNRDYWVVLDDALENALDGDGAGLLRLADLYASRRPDGTYADNTMEAFFTIGCLDNRWSVPAAQVPKHVPAFEKASPTLGRAFAWGLPECGTLPVDVPEPDWAAVDAAGADPLLVVGTTRDPATPMEWSRRLAAQLEPAVLVTRDGDGHTGYQSGNRCVDEVIEGYLLDGDVPSDDVDCPAP
jgi:pimeloyl-ACP methyl ester carboxylesterase